MKLSTHDAIRQTSIAGIIALLIILSVATLMSGCSTGNLGTLEGTYRLPGGKGVVSISVPLYRVPLARPILLEPPQIPMEPDGSLFPTNEK